MKGFILGVLIALSLNQGAKALEIELSRISVKDYFMGCMAVGLATKSGMNQRNPQELADEAATYANALMAKRNK